MYVKAYNIAKIFFLSNASGGRLSQQKWLRLPTPWLCQVLSLEFYLCHFYLTKLFLSVSKNTKQYGQIKLTALRLTFNMGGHNNNLSSLAPSVRQTLEVPGALVIR